MKLSIETISALRVSLYDCGSELPAKIIEREKPSNHIRSAWIPQTIADQIWVLYEFATVADREIWEAKLSPQLRDWLDRDMIEHALPFTKWLG